MKDVEVTAVGNKRVTEPAGQSWDEWFNAAGGLPLGKVSGEKGVPADIHGASPSTSRLQLFVQDARASQILCANALISRIASLKSVSSSSVGWLR